MAVTHPPFRSRLCCVVLAASWIAIGAPAYAQATSDRQAITESALDYIEGFYNGDPARMERSLHPDLAKRIVRTDASGRPRLDHMTAPQLVQAARSRAGKATPADRQQKDVTVLDLFGQSASVKIVANDWIDYLHLSKWEGRWVIVNVLWEMKPPAR